MLFSEMKCTYLCQFDPPALQERPIVCSNCDSNFAVKVDLKVHAESAHERFAEKLDTGIHMNLFMKRRNHFNVQFVIQTLLS